jgi:hypothetical protein
MLLQEINMDKGMIKILTIIGGEKMEDEKLKMFQGKGQKNILAEELREMQKGLPEIIEYWKLQAQIQRAYYLELVNQGFSEDQALQLTMGVFE